MNVRPFSGAAALATGTCCCLLLGACGSGGDIRLFPGAPSPGDPAEEPVPATRDPKVLPYASTSIWNTAIGDQAALLDISLGAASAGIRTEAVVILLDLEAALLSVRHSDAGWTGADRCPAEEPEHFVAHASEDFLALGGPGQSGTPVVALQDNGRTLEQGLPFVRCTPNAPATIAFTEGAGDLYGDGIEGANGGSGLSALGGVLRLGELLPSADPPRHALAIHLWGQENLWAAPSRGECFRWPAWRADSYCLDAYGGNEPELRMGSLLALPPGELPSLRTQAAAKLAWTLQTYGAYVVNDAGSPGYAFNVELSPSGYFVEEFAAAWGFSFATEDVSSDWSLDIQTLFDALRVVTDNEPTSPGGAGTPLQPPHPALTTP